MHTQVCGHNYNYMFLTLVCRWTQALKDIVTNCAVSFNNYEEIISDYVEIHNNYVDIVTIMCFSPLYAAGLKHQKMSLLIMWWYLLFM